MSDSVKKKNTPVTEDKTVHVVRAGENLSTIARRYRVTVAQIAKANSLASRSKLFVGASLVIPD